MNSRNHLLVKPYDVSTNTSDVHILNMHSICYICSDTSDKICELKTVKISEINLDFFASVPFSENQKCQHSGLDLMKTGLLAASLSLGLLQGIYQINRLNKLLSWMEAFRAIIFVLN